MSRIGVFGLIALACLLAVFLLTGGPSRLANSAQHQPNRGPSVMDNPQIMPNLGNLGNLEAVRPVPKGGMLEARMTEVPKLHDGSVVLIILGKDMYPISVTATAEGHTLRLELDACRKIVEAGDYHLGNGVGLRQGEWFFYCAVGSYELVSGRYIQLAPGTLVEVRKNPKEGDTDALIRVRQAVLEAAAARNKDQK